jgi:hypothetical protein
MSVLQSRHVRVAAGSFLLACFAACQASGWYEHRFQPAPLESEVRSEAAPGSQVRALVTVLGIERGRDGAKDRALVRMRLENIGSVPAQLEADSLSLVSADLKAFGPATVEPPPSQEIGQGQNATFDCGFPLPEGKGPYELDLSGINLRFTVIFVDKKVTTGMTFQRTDWRYYDPGYPRVQVGLGVGWYDCH